jgi:AraC family transcriptional regulator, transcriptional activator of pobA
MLMIILVRLSRVVPDTFKKGASKHNVVLMRQFEKLIEQHFREKRLPKEYAEMMFVTPNHLNALSNDVAGKSAGELIRERILLEAKRLLANSDLMISQIAAILHFEDNAYFTRFFKKYLGTTPEGFRAAYIQSNNF